MSQLLLRLISIRPKYAKVLQSFACPLQLDYVDNVVNALAFQSSLRLTVLLDL